MNRLFWSVAGGLCCLVGPVAADQGNTLKLTMTLTMEQSTCDVSLLTPATVTFPPLALSALQGDAGGHITYAGNQTVTVGLSNCAGSAKAGAVPAIQVTGTTPVAEAPELFREYSSTAGGNLGFGIRYEPVPGQPQDYLKSGDYIDLGAQGSETTDRNLNFLVDMLHRPTGDSPTSGYLVSRINFQFTYH